MSQGYVIPVDPSELANRVPAEQDPLSYEGDFWKDHKEDPFDLEGDISTEDVTELFSDDYREKILALLDRIPEREADLIDLYYIKWKKQAHIAHIFGVTQAAISYRLNRATKRMKFLLSIPDVCEEDMRDDLAEEFTPMDVDILVGMWKTTCQSEVARSLGLIQGRVRHRFFKAVSTLETASQKNSKFEVYHKIFSSIASKNFNILREVKLPQWSDRGGNECL